VGGPAEVLEYPVAEFGRQAVELIERVRGTKRLLIPTVAVAAGALTAGIVLAAELPGSSQGAGSAPKATGAATVQRQNLVATDTESGTLGYANTGTVYNRLSGTITWLPAAGQEIKPGRALFKVDNRPVILMDGTTPAFRTMTSGVSDGPDIQELNQNLVTLGFDPSHEIAVDQTWQAGTTDAVDRWQASLGETQTGTVTLGQVVFLPGPRLVSSVSAVTGSTGSGSAAGSGSGQAAVYTGPTRTQFVDLTTATSTTSSADATSDTMKPAPGPGSSSGGRSNAQLLALIQLLKAEIAELKAQAPGAARGGGGGGGGAGTGSAAGRGGAVSAGGGTSSGAGSGSGGGSAQAVMQTTSTQEVVTVNLDATKQTEAVVGEQVTVQLPDSTTVDGRITQVSPVAQSSGSGSGGSGGGAGGSSSPSATIPVTIALTGHRHVQGLDQAAVSVNFAQQRANNVLSVPVTALIATQGGGYAVQPAAAPHQLIPVTPGLFAAGYVQISGPGIYEGLQVTDSQG
jgi:hypothetical protein